MSLGLCFKVVFFLALFTMSGRVWGYNCHTYSQALEILKNHSLFAFKETSSVWKGYLERLDENKLFLSEKEFSELLAELRGVDVASCEKIEEVGSRVASIAKGVLDDVSDLYRGSVAKVHSSSDVLKTRIPLSLNLRAQSRVEMYQHWQRYLLFRSFVLGSSYGEEAFRKEFLELLETQITSTSHYYVLFIEALYQAVDPYSKVYPDGFRLQKKGAYHQSSMYNFFKFLKLNLSWSWRGRARGYFKVDYVAPSQVVTRFSDYYKIQKGDWMVPTWSREPRDLRNFLVLRREREGLRWDEYPHFSSDIQGVRDDFHHFFFPTSFKIALKGEQEALAFAGDLVVSEEVTVRSHVMYWSLREFFDGAEDEDVFRQKIKNILGDFRLKTKDKFDSYSILLDLRNAPLSLSLKKYLLILGSFLPRTPTAMVQSRQGVQVYAHQKDAFDELYEGPLVVLVDPDTEGYGELMAATLQEYGRALILGAGLGKNTSGRSLASSVFTREVPGHPNRFINYRLSTGLLRTPGGDSVFLKGLKPHITLAKERDVHTQKSWVSGALRSLPSVSSALKKCYVPLSSQLISLLKKRSDERVLSSSYLRQVRVQDDVSKELLQEYLPFHKAFPHKPSELRGQKPLPSCEPECSELSLVKEEVHEDQRFSLMRNKIYKQVSGGSFLDAAALEDPLLKEALTMAAEYAYFKEVRDLVSVAR